MNRYLLFLLLCTSSWGLAEEREDIQLQTQFRVVLEPKNRTVLASEVRVPVTKVSKQLGEHFEEREVLIALDDRIYKANLERMRAEEVKAETELEAKQQLFGDDIASLFELKKAEADYAAAIARRVEAERLLESTQVLAPYHGKVVDVFIEEHELPDIGDDLIEIVNDEVLVAQILVPAQWLPYIWEQRDFVVRIEETGEEIPARIQRIGAVINPASSTIPIEAEIDNQDHHLLAGMRGTAIFRFTKSVPVTDTRLKKSNLPAQKGVIPQPKSFFIPQTEKPLPVPGILQES